MHDRPKPHGDPPRHYFLQMSAPDTTLDLPAESLRQNVPKAIQRPAEPKKPSVLSRKSVRKPS
jgi:hypothetical protein